MTVPRLPGGSAGAGSARPADPRGFPDLAARGWLAAPFSRRDQPLTRSGPSTGGTGQPGGSGPPTGAGPDTLRADLGTAGCGSAPRPLSTGRPGPSRVTPVDRAALPPRSAPRTLDLAASGGARAARRPMAQRCSTQPRRAPGPTSCGGPGRTYSPPTSHCQHPCDLRTPGKSAGQWRGTGATATRRHRSTAHRSAACRKAQVTRSAGGGSCDRRRPCAARWAAACRG